MTGPFVIFDFDGVIADTERLHLTALQTTLAQRGVSLGADEYEAKYLGYTDHDLLAAFATDRAIAWNREDVDAIVAAKSLAFDALLSQATVVYPSAARLIDRLVAAEATLAIASGAFRHEIETILDAARMRHHFPVIVGSGDYATGKPSPAPFLEAAKRCGVASALAIAIEDSPWGLAAARAAGCATIAVTHTYASARLDADAIVDSLDEIDEALLIAVRSGGRN